MGNNRVVAQANSVVIQKNHFYPFGMAFAEGTTAEQKKQPYKYGGKELDLMFGLNLYDSHARQQASEIPRFTSVDPLAEKYYSWSPYVYCFNNPLRFTDPTGREVDLSEMSEEERKRYELQIVRYRNNSSLFDVMYSSLEKSKEVYTVQYGKTAIGNEKSGAVEGQFTPNKDGGGTVTFSDAIKEIKGGTLSEELFHAYQHDNRLNYTDGEFNIEFEAKVGVTAIGSEHGGFGEIPGAKSFQNKISYGDYGKNMMIITPENVTSSSFLKDYKTAANSYSKYNRDNNVGNSFYRTSTTVAPYSLQQIVKKAYGK